MRSRTLFAAVLLLLGGGPCWSADDPPISSNKLNHYVKGFNFLAGTFGLEQEYRQYTAQHVEQKTVNQGVTVNDGWIGLGEDELRQGQAIEGGGLPEVDAAAGTMVPILGRLVERLKGLEGYYASRGQLEDNFARGKREDPLVLADFKAALAALGPLSGSLDAAIDRRDTADLYAMQKAGDLVGFNGGMAMHQAKRLLALLDGPQALRDPKVTARTDTLADQILQSIEDERKARAVVKASGEDPHALRDSMFDSAAESLQGMVGTYRELRHGGSVALYPMLVSAYNSAVENANIGQ